jgi:hypothetical protein
LLWHIDGQLENTFLVWGICWTLSSILHQHNCQLVQKVLIRPATRRTLKKKITDRDAADNRLPKDEETRVYTTRKKKKKLQNKYASDLDLSSPAENISVITNELDIRVTPFISLYFLELLKQPCPRCLPQKTLEHTIFHSCNKVISAAAKTLKSNLYPSPLSGFSR